jgi:nucleotide-binding universal stress UspA family protein
MYKHILIPTDGSDLSKDAFRCGISLAKAVNAKVTGINVTAPFHTFMLERCGNSDALTDTAESYSESYKKRTAAIATKYLEQVKEEATRAGVQSYTVHVEHEHPFQAIIDTAKTRGCDLIVMASHGRRGISAIVLGSETVKVLTHSTIPVLVLRG